MPRDVFRTSRLALAGAVRAFHPRPRHQRGKHSRPACLFQDATAFHIDMRPNLTVAAYCWARRPSDTSESWLGEARAACRRHSSP